jgi:thiamine pyrophosphate-dependent acetolactate synthase large subunit-like protein
LGIALARPDRRAIALEGDGSSIAGMPVLASIGRLRPANLVVVIVDNGIYGTGTGTVETATRHGTDLAAVARACGIPSDQVVTPTDDAAVAASLEAAMRVDGPWVVVVKVEPDASVATDQRPTPGLDFVEASLRFQERFR